MSERSQTCFPSLNCLQRETGRRKPNIVAAIRELENVGLLEVQRQQRAGRGQVNRYQAVVPKGSPSEPFTDKKGSPSEPEVEVKLSLELLKNRSSNANGHANGKPTPRRRDELWDVLVEELGEPQTASERGRRNKALKELRSIAATADDLRARIRGHRYAWPDIDLTATGLTANWTLLGQHAQELGNGDLSVAERMRRHAKEVELRLEGRL